MAAGPAIVPAWSILFPDKSAISAETADGILQRIALSQWEPCSVAQVRSRLVDRAFVWSGVMVREATSTEDFLRDLADVGMFVLVEPWPPVVYNGDNNETDETSEKEY